MDNMQHCLSARFASAYRLLNKIWQSWLWLLYLHFTGVAEHSKHRFEKYSSAHRQRQERWSLFHIIFSLPHFCWAEKFEVSCNFSWVNKTLLFWTSVSWIRAELPALALRCPAPCHTTTGMPPAQHPRYTTAAARLLPFERKSITKESTKSVSHSSYFRTNIFAGLCALSLEVSVSFLSSLTSSVNRDLIRFTLSEKISRDCYF